MTARGRARAGRLNAGLVTAAGVVLLEGIRLAEVQEGAYVLNAAPLNLSGADGSPCRAILIDDGR